VHRQTLDALGRAAVSKARSTRAAVSFAIAAPTSRFCVLEQTGVAQRGRRPLLAGWNAPALVGTPSGFMSTDRRPP
jgi:hypothetical protein